MGFSDWLKKSSKNQKETLRKKEAEIDESPTEQFLNAIHSGGKEIIINSDFYLTETLVLDVDDIVLDGQGHTIQPSGRNTPILIVNANNITLKNIIFKKASSNTDGAAINNLKGNLNIIGCKFIGNYAHDSNGGAIYNLEGKLNIEKCDFIDNRTERNDGGAIYNFNGELNIEGCTFENNYAKFGGAIYNGNALNLTGSTFKNNSGLKGPAIFNTFNSDATLRYCEFKRDQTDMLKNKFEIHNQGTVNIESAQKEELEEITQGGFIHINSENAKTFKNLNLIISSGEKEIKLDSDIINKEFKKGIDIDKDNLVIDGCGFTVDGLGKGIFNVTGENVTLKNINFRNGSSTEGGAINNKSNSLKIINCNFDRNISNAGGAISNEGIADIENCNFRKNFANESDGGAINNKGELNINNCDFLSNTTDENGGAINNTNIVKIDKNCNFISNHAKNGASISNGENATLTLSDAKFKSNRATNQGSIIYNDNIAHVEKCESKNNISTKYSNIIYQTGGENNKLNLKDCSFSRDKYNNNLIYVENGSCDIKSTQFDLKKEHENSYAIYNENGILQLENLEFGNVNNESIYNDNKIYIKQGEDIEKYVKTGSNGSPYEYNTNI